MILNKLAIRSTLWISILGCFSASASIADEYPIPSPSASQDARVGALMPYTRYDSGEAILGGGAKLVTSTNVDPYNIASQASERSYVALPSSGAYAEWTMTSSGDGVTMRFTLPDTANGMGQEGSLDIYVNGQKVTTVNLTSYYMWQHFTYGSGTVDIDNPGSGKIGCFAFDETHFILPRSLSPGDKIRVQSSGAKGLEYGVDFLEIESVPDEISKPAGAVSVTDYGAVADDGRDDLTAFNNALAAANRGSKILYIPAGTYHLSKIWYVNCTDVMITGAGMWHTNLQFTSSQQQGGGISGDCSNVELCNMYINSNLRSRYGENAIYKCIMDVWKNGSVIHDIWQDHFECGMWLGDYNGVIEYSDGLKIVNCRLRNNLADGVNFCQGTSNATVYNCSIRNCGDDGLAIWNNNYMSAKDESGNVFAYNTVDLIWRAGGIAIYGGDAHRIYNNYICDMFMASGIHLNNKFDGYKYSATKKITFENNYLVRCGTNLDCWREDLGAVDLVGEVKNVSFVNTGIYDSPYYAIRILSEPTGISFTDTRIYGSGLTGSDIDYSCVTHTACAIRLQNDNVKFTNTQIANVHADVRRNNSTWPLWTDNNAARANSVGYEYLDDVTYSVPGYPGADQSGDIDDPMRDLYGYNIRVAGLHWGTNVKSSEIREGDAVMFTALIHNDSNVDIPAGVRIGIRVTVDGKTSLTSNDFAEGIPAGTSVKMSPTSAWLATAGGHTIEVTADHRNKLPDETSKEDNVITRKFNVYETENPTPSFTPVTGGYDLTVVDLNVRNLDRTDGKIMVGDRIVFAATVVNAGDRAVPAGQKIGVQFFVDGLTWDKGYITWNDQHTSGLAAHQSVVLEATGGGAQNIAGNHNYWTALSGTHDVTAWVDDSDLYKEVDETNNQLTRTFDLPYNGIQYFADSEVDTPDDLDGVMSGVENVSLSEGVSDPYWYSLSGRRYTSKPTTPGIYIHEGVKHLIR